MRSRLHRRLLCRRDGFPNLAVLPWEGTTTRMAEHDHEMSGRALKQAFLLTSATTQASRRLSSCEWVAAVDQERRRAVKVETLCVFGRINTLLRDLHVFASDVGQRLPQPPFSQFPVRTAVEELDGDSHGCDEPRTVSGPGPRFWCSRR